MRKAGKALSSLLNFSIAGTLALMSLLVFLNVILRYVFNSGITWSEELSRFLFVWMVFLGAIAALKDNMHLAVTILLDRLPAKAKKFCLVLSHLLILFVLCLLLDGSWKMTVLNLDSKAPATGLPLAFVYGIGMVTGISMAVIVLRRLLRLLLNRGDGGKNDADVPASSVADPGHKGGV